MAQRAIKIEVPFRQLLTIVDQLTPIEKTVLRKRLEEGGPLSWQEKSGRVLDDLGERNKDVPLEQVEQDVDRAVKEVRANGFWEKVEQELNECMAQMKTNDVLGAARKAKEKASKLMTTMLPMPSTQSH